MTLAAKRRHYFLPFVAVLGEHLEHEKHQTSLAISFFAIPAFDLILERAFLSQDMMVVLCKSVGFVSNVLQKPQRKRLAAQSNWLFFARAEDFFVAFGQRYHYGWLDLLIAKRSQGGIQLTFSPVDHEQVGKGILLVAESSKSARDDFVNASKVVDPFHFLNLVPSIPRFERKSV